MLGLLLLLSLSCWPLSSPLLLLSSWQKAPRGSKQGEGKGKGKFVELEALEGIAEDEELIDERILQQAKATKVVTDIRERLAEPFREADRNKSVGEVLADLGVECGEGRESGDAVESFRKSSASAAVARAIRREKNIVAAAEYLALLYATAREQEKFGKFREVYFGMKDVEGFMDKVDEEAICFGGAVSGFTSKSVAVRSLLTKNKKGNMLCGVLFRVQNARGYKIGKVGDEADEVLLEVGSVFKVEGMREVVSRKFFVVDLSYVSPITESDRIEL